MIRFTITGVAPFDGVHDLDLPERELNMRELHIVKGLSGVRMGELNESLDAMDSDVMVALIVVALIRTGRVSKERWQRTADLFLDAEAGSIQAEAVEPKAEEEATDVPPSPPLLEDETRSGEHES